MISNNASAIKIHRFKPHKDLQPGMTIVLIGRRRSGKTTAIKNLLYHLSPRMEMGWIFCPTISNNKDFSKSMPSDFIHTTLDLSLIQRIIQFQCDRIKKGCVRHVFIVIDDFAHDRKNLRSPVIDSLFTNGRHYFITPIIGLQFGVAITPAARRNADIVCMCKENTEEERKKLFDGYTDGFRNKQEFADVMKHVCVDHTMLVFNKTKTQLECPVFSWKAEFPCKRFLVNPLGFWWHRKKRVSSSKGNLHTSNNANNPRRIIEDERFKELHTQNRPLQRTGRTFLIEREDSSNLIVRPTYPLLTSQPPAKTHSKYFNTQPPPAPRRTLYHYRMTAAPNITHSAGVVPRSTIRVNIPPPPANIAVKAQPRCQQPQQQYTQAYQQPNKTDDKADDGSLIHILFGSEF